MQRTADELATYLNGTVDGDGKSKVAAKNLTQVQAGGALNQQSMTLGKVKGSGSSDVNADRVTQVQAGGALNKQSMNVGNVSSK